MSKIFFDADGAEFEYVREYSENGFVVRPVKQEPKWELDWKWKHDGVTEVRVKVPDTDSTQTQAIKEAVEALMEYINGDGRYTSELTQPADEARKAMGDKA